MTSPLLIGFSNNTDPASLNAAAADLARRWRQLAADTRSFAAWFALWDQATVQTLFNLDPDKAAAESYAIALMNTLAQIFYGQVQQGGTGGTGATLEDFDTGLRVMAGPNVPVSV